MFKKRKINAELEQIREELQNIRSILEFSQLPRYTTKEVNGKRVRVPFDRDEVFNRREAD